MTTGLDYYLRNIPYEVNFSDIQEFERFEERFFDVDRHFVNIIGMGEDFVEFCPDEDPPNLKEEVLPWLWVTHPELKSELIEIADDKLKALINEYEAILPDEAIVVDINTVAVVFEDTAIRHAAAIEKGEYRIANKLQKELTAIYEVIKVNNTWIHLYQLLNHPQENVRLCAATFLLGHDQETALSVLTELASSKTIVGLTASTTIDMFHKGMLNLL